MDALWLPDDTGLVAAATIAGSVQNPLELVEVAGADTELAHVSIWRPCLVDLQNAWLPLAGFGAIYLLRVNLFIVPKSRAFFEKVLPWLCASAVVAGIAGMLQVACGLQPPPAVEAQRPYGSFAGFAHDGHWAAFALLWMVACSALGLLQLRSSNRPGFRESHAPWYFFGATLLGLSGIFLEARLPAVILLLSFSTMTVICIRNIAPLRDEPQRRMIFSVSALLGLVAAAQRLTQRPDGATTAALRASTRQMFLDHHCSAGGWMALTTCCRFTRPTDAGQRS